VPDVVAGGNGAEGNSLVNVLLANLVRDGIGKRAGVPRLDAST
jgi:hypothetical protein